MTTQEKNKLLGNFVGHNILNCAFPQYNLDAGALLKVWYKFRELDMQDASYVYTRSIVSEALAWGQFSDFYKEMVNAVQWYNSIKEKGNVQTFIH